jgi:hypothetical protein
LFEFRYTIFELLDLCLNRIHLLLIIGHYSTQLRLVGLSLLIVGNGGTRAQRERGQTSY